MKRLTFIGMVVLALAAYSCQKPVEYPIEPRIAFEGCTYVFNADSTFSGQVVVPLERNSLEKGILSAVFNTR